MSAYVRVVKMGVQADMHPKLTSREIDSMFDKEGLRLLYRSKGEVIMHNPVSCSIVLKAVLCLQQAFRVRMFKARFLSELDKRTLLHPSALALESTLVIHGLDKYVKPILDDDHDYLTLAMCSVGDLTATYAMPLASAARLLRHIKEEGLDTATQTQARPRYTNKDTRSAVALILARAAVLLLHVRLRLWIAWT